MKINKKVPLNPLKHKKKKTKVRDTTTKEDHTDKNKPTDTGSRTQEPTTRTRRREGKREKISTTLQNDTQTNKDTTTQKDKGTQHTKKQKELSDTEVDAEDTSSIDFDNELDSLKKQQRTINERLAKVESAAKKNIGTDTTNTSKSLKEKKAVLKGNKMKKTHLTLVPRESTLLEKSVKKARLLREEKEKAAEEDEQAFVEQGFRSTLLSDDEEA